MQDLSAAYLILSADPLVALDLAQTVREFDAGARILVASNTAEAAALVVAEARIAVALLGLSPEAAAAIGAEVCARGGRPVLFGADADLAGASWPGEVLAVPFTSECVIALLVRLSAG